MSRLVRCAVLGAFGIALAGCSDVNVPSNEDTSGSSACPDDCDDGLACTEDACEDGQCRHEVKDGACLVDGACYVEGDDDPDNACRTCQPLKNKEGWSVALDASCDDGEPCTVDDTCREGATCTGEWDPDREGCACQGPEDCDDGLACTNDACQGDGACTFQVKGNRCLIGGACYEAGDPQPDAPCMACRPDQSTDQWSAAENGTTCADDGLSCTRDECQGGACAHPRKAGTCTFAGQCYEEGSHAIEGCSYSCVGDGDGQGWANHPAEGCPQDVADAAEDTSPPEDASATDVGPEDTGGDDTGVGDGLLCYQVSPCIQAECPEPSQQCYQEALNGTCAPGSEQEEELFQLVQECSQQCQDADARAECLQSECASAWGECNAGGSYGEQSCSEILECLNACGNDPGCRRECASEGSPEANEQFAQFALCLQSECPDGDQDCQQEAAQSGPCSDEAQACQSG